MYVKVVKRLSDSFMNIQYFIVKSRVKAGITSIERKCKFWHCLAFQSPYRGVKSDAISKLAFSLITLSRSCTMLPLLKKILSKSYAIPLTTWTMLNAKCKFTFKASITWGLTNHQYKSF